MALLCEREDCLKSFVERDIRGEQLADLHNEFDEWSRGEIDAPLALREDGLEFGQHPLELVFLVVVFYEIDEEMLCSGFERGGRSIHVLLEPLQFFLKSGGSRRE